MNDFCVFIFLTQHTTKNVIDFQMTRQDKKASENSEQFFSSSSTFNERLYQIFISKT